MYDLCWLIAVTRREYSEKYISFFKENSVNSVFSCLCEGTATQKILDIWGLESKAMVMFSCMTSLSDSEKLLRRLSHTMRIDAPGSGIALTVPLESSPVYSLALLDIDKNILKNEVENMNEMPYSLIISISEKGCSDMVMDAARDAGARGGTVVHAKGTAASIAPKFFGISLADEKELIYIVAKSADRDNIMSAIAQKAGKKSQAHAVVFSLPVNAVSGLFADDD